MDVLYPCSLCSRTFMLRNDFLSHMTTSHPSSVPSVHTNEIKCLFNCPQCCKQFSSKIVLKKHIQMKHNISIQKLSEYTPTLLKTCRISRDLNNYLFLKVSILLYVNFFIYIANFYCNLRIIYMY